MTYFSNLLKILLAFYYSTMDFGIPRTVSSERTSKVDRSINNLEPLTLNKDVRFYIALPGGGG